MRFSRFFLIAFVLYSQAVFSLEEFYILKAREKAGMFSIFFDVLGILDFYEKGLCNGLKVDFDTTGTYYDESKGTNWWEYYFHPLDVGTKENVRVLDCQTCFLFAVNVEYSMERKRAYDLIQKHIQIKPEILREVERFQKEHFSIYTIGVHYRGTDKITEVPLVAYEKVKNEIDKYIVGECKIFLATDDENFLKYMQLNYGSMVTFKAIERSIDSTPLHLSPKDPYLQGKEALIDALLLSKTCFLIRTSSNLSLASSFFNPYMPVIELSKRDPTVFIRL